MANKIEGKTFFITGGAGFIGSNMVERLMKERANVVVYDNLSSGNYKYIEMFDKGRSEFKFIKADILELDQLNKSMSASRPDVVIHLAANPDVRRSIIETDLDLKQGTIATYNVLEASRKNDVKDILFSSSSVVYGPAKVKPTPENYGPLAPISLYGASKLASEGLITSFSHLFGMKYYIYRFANVVGKNATHGVIIDFARKLKKNNKELEVLGDGKQKKSYVEVEDCIDGMLFVYKKSENAENIYNLTTDDQASVKEIAELTVQKFAKNAKINYTGTPFGWPGDIANTFLSNEKIKALGWKPKYSSPEAVRKTIDVVYDILH